MTKVVSEKQRLAGLNLAGCSLQDRAPRFLPRVIRDVQSETRALRKVPISDTTQEKYCSERSHLTAAGDKHKRVRNGPP